MNPFRKGKTDRPDDNELEIQFHDDFLKPWQKPKSISGTYDWDYGQSGTMEKMRYMTEFGRPEFICLWCKVRFVFRYCPHCGHALNETMECPQCGFDFKKNPPVCKNCYEATTILCPQCRRSVFIGEHYCAFCGRKMR